MIPLSEINQFSQKFNIPSDTIEKDYAICWVLICLAKSNLANHFMFYGGTALKRIYFEDHRYSEDIDFLSTSSLSLDYILMELNCLNYAQTAANLLLEVDHSNIFSKKDRIQLYIKYSGFNEIVGSPKVIRIDFAMNRELYGLKQNHTLIKTYSDIKNQKMKLYVMSLNTILATKIGLLYDISRNEPRDLFDIWFLLKRRHKFDYNFEEINSIIKNKYGFYLSKPTLIHHLNNSSIKRNWNARLSKQISGLPIIDNVIREIATDLNLDFKEGAAE